MPRVENVGPEVDAYCEETYEGSSVYDVCNDCASELESDPNMHNDKLQSYNGDPQGSEGWQGDCEHPEYSEEEYDCDVCGERLTNRNA